MIVESCTGQLSDWEKNIQRMSLPQLLNYLRFLRWRRSSSKTKACKFLGNRSPHAVAAAPFDRQAFWPFFQIDSFPWFDLISAVYLKSTAGFAVTQPFFHHGFHDQLLKFWRVSFVWFSSWHNLSLVEDCIISCKVLINKHFLHSLHEILSTTFSFLLVILHPTTLDRSSKWKHLN